MRRIKQHTETRDAIRSVLGMPCLVWREDMIGGERTDCYSRDGVHFVAAVDGRVQLAKYDDGTTIEFDEGRYFIRFLGSKGSEALTVMESAEGVAKERVAKEFAEDSAKRQAEYDAMSPKEKKRFHREIGWTGDDGDQWGGDAELRAKVTKRRRDFGY